MADIHPTAIVPESVEIGEGTSIGPYVIMEEGVRLGRGNKVWPHAFIGRGTVMGDRNEVHPGAVIGHSPQDLKFDPEMDSGTIIGDGNVFRERCSVHRASKPGTHTVVGSGGFFMSNTHIAHDCKVGDRVILVNNSSLSGHCEIGDGAIMSGLTGLHQFCRVGRLAMVSALSVTNKDLPPFMTFGGRPMVSQGLNLVGLRRAGIEREARAELKEAYRWLYRRGLPINEALEGIERELGCPEVAELVAFVRASKRGICLGAGEIEDTVRSIKKSGPARHGLATEAPEPKEELDS